MRIFEGVAPLGGRFVTRIDDEAARLRQTRGSDEFVGMPPVARACGRAARAENALVEAVELLAFFGRLQALARRPGRSGKCRECGRRPSSVSCDPMRKNRSRRKRHARRARRWPRGSRPNPRDVAAIDPIASLPDPGARAFRAISFRTPRPACVRRRDKSRHPRPTCRARCAMPARGFRSRRLRTSLGHSTPSSIGPLHHLQCGVKKHSVVRRDAPARCTRRTCL